MRPSSDGESSDMLLDVQGHLRTWLMVLGSGAVAVACTVGFVVLMVLWFVGRIGGGDQ